MKDKLIECFQDTIKLINSNSNLLNLTKQAMQGTSLIYEKIDFESYSSNKKGVITVCEDTTFNAAKPYSKSGKKVAVLNFASAVNPCGGVTIGVMAQEECLCRSSNLAPCLKQQYLMKEYYMPHRIAKNPMYSDKLIYTKGVTVFKDDAEVPQLMPENEWFNVDVITCAAPNITKRKYTNKTALKELFKGRIKNIFEASIDNGVEVIILGAFGCGTFKNPPEVVAKAFHEVIDENNYIEYFSEIVFAIKYSMDSSNCETFVKEFYTPETCENFPDHFFLLSVCPEYVLPEIVLPSGSIIDMVTVSEDAGLLTNIDEVKTGIANGKDYFVHHYSVDSDEIYNKQCSFIRWQYHNKYFNKQFSIFGDSISTLAGYNPKGYKVFYDDENCKKSDVREMNDTWWGKVIDFFGGELLVNNSWSGSRVTRLPNNDSLFPSGCSDARTGSLHINSVKPDVIIVYLGTNDWAFGARRNDETRVLDFDEMEYFESAYDEMLKKLKSNYPKAEIWCCTLCSTKISTNPSFSFPENYNGNDVNYYNDVIRDIVLKNNCKLIDLYSYHLPYDSIDGSHPNADGMNTLATLIIRSTGGKQIEQFVDCENNQHEYFVAEQYSEATKYICKKCGKQVVVESDSVDVDDKDNGVEENSTTCPNCGAKININDKFCLMCGKKVFPDNDLAEQESNEDENKQEEFTEIVGDRYKLIRQVGKGASSIVYLAQDIKLERICAVKLIKKDTYANTIAAQESLDEANKMKLLAHISVPQLYDIYDDDEKLCIVMEFIEGKNLSEIIKALNKPLDEYTVVSWSKQLCRVLFYLHTLKPPRIFRDLKPANIILQPNGVIKLIDFGTMKNYDESRTEDTVNLGTKGYAAPEQFGGRGQTDARTDIYGLGMTMYHLITGISPALPPFEFKPIRYYRKDISWGLENIVMKCIKVEREERYQSAMDLLNDLEKLNL